MRTLQISVFCMKLQSTAEQRSGFPTHDVEAAKPTLESCIYDEVSSKQSIINTKESFHDREFHIATHSLKADLSSARREHSRQPAYQRRKHSPWLAGGVSIASSGCQIFSLFQYIPAILLGIIWSLIGPCHYFLVVIGALNWCLSCFGSSMPLRVEDSKRRRALFSVVCS